MDKIQIGRKQVEISDWCEFVAQNEDGAWYEYSIHPEPPCRNPCSWDVSPFKGYWKYLTETKPPKDWTQEIYQIERSH